MNVNHLVPWWNYFGKYLGYPKCCVDYFCDHPGDFSNPDRKKAASDTGFIPCPECAERVIKGEIKLEELIQNRKLSTPFPESNVDEIEEVSAEFDSYNLIKC